MIHLIINGKTVELGKPTLLSKFLESTGVNLQFVAVAHNGTILDRNQFESTLLNQGDEMEIVRPVGGG